MSKKKSIPIPIEVYERHPEVPDTFTLVAISTKMRIVHFDL